MQSNLKEQHQHAELGKTPQHRIRRIDQSKKRGAKQNAGNQLSNYGWLTNSLSNGAKRLRCREQRDERKQKVRK
jgi:hypothetical protein